MKSLLLIIFCSGTILAKPTGLYQNAPLYHSNGIEPVIHQTFKTQFHTQDELGQYAYGYSDGLSSKTESKSLDGITHGSYSYLDSNGIVQNVNYIADDINGFRVAASNLPVAHASVPINQAAIPVPAGTGSAPPSSIIQSVADPIAQAEQIYSPTGIIASDSASYPVHHQPPPQYPSVPNYPFIQQRPTLITDIIPQYDPNVSADEDTVEVTAAKILANGGPQPVLDTPEVAAAKLEHYAAVQQAQQQQMLNADSNNYDNNDDDDDDSDNNESDITGVSSMGAAAIHTPIHASAFIGSPQYPYAQYQIPSAAAGPTSNIITQFHSQDELGQYSYGYSGGPSAKTETKTLDGITRGSYSYIDANGKIQQVNYISDPTNGFRVAASNLPVAPVAQHETNQIRK